MRHGQIHTAGQGFATEALAWDWLRRAQNLINEETITGKRVWTPPAERLRKSPEGEEAVRVPWCGGVSELGVAL